MPPRLPLSPWRTVVVILVVLLVLLIGYVLAIVWPAAPFSAFATACCTLAGVAAAKSTAEHVAKRGKAADQE